ncbi:hypothetical protein [Luteimonas kalidii]|uniref:Uncharacterized protein n=1 Tax=Luteimonas kalidii TaxID=3042025 RepID=A0ABT6JQI2_9GAMM|nr:hypothetical protein [Luteimonas kalidii]MDH5832738.1 hypothetical protein [Luteimonas kalidii]
MNIRQVQPATIALLVAGALVLATGLYTVNTGLQLAGGLILIVGAILALGQASGPPRDR